MFFIRCYTTFLNYFTFFCIFIWLVLHYFVDLRMFNSKPNKMETLKQKLQDLQEALKNKSISVNEYSSMYHATYQQIKKLQNA